MKITVEIDAPTLVWLVFVILAILRYQVAVARSMSGCRQPKVEAAYAPGAPIRA